MSIYLFLKCDECDQLSEVIGRNTEHEDGIEDSLGILKWRLYDGASRFLIQHKGHSVRLMDENQVWPESCPWSSANKWGE